jgi:PAS domain S-box-containing protein
MKSDVSDQSSGATAFRTKAPHTARRSPRRSSAITQPAGHGHGEHFVQFYESDDFLLRCLSAFVADSIAAGDPAIIIATPKHRHDLTVRLKSSGIDVADAAACGVYIELDAAETLARFMVNDWPDKNLFQQSVGKIITEVKQRGQNVRAFGEMVALLWQDRMPDAALRLEELWNELAKAQPLTLFCAYPILSFDNSGHMDAFMHICGEHSRIVPAESYTECTDEPSRLRAIAQLQQQAAALRLETSERRRSEESLRQKRDELSSFLENAPVGMSQVGTNGLIEWANAAELQLLGFSLAEYVGRPLRDNCVDASEAEAIVSRIARGEKLRGLETLFKCRNGSIKTVAIDSIPVFHNGRLVHTRCFMRDITDQKRAEDASRWLTAIIESSEDAIISKNLKGIITSWNQSAQRIFGYTADEIVGKPVTMLIPEDHQDEEPDILRRLQRGERIEHYETIRRRKDGTLVNISLTVSPVKNAQGVIVGASKIARDITPRKYAERRLAEVQSQLTRTNEELEQRVQERTRRLREAIEQMEEFSYSVSHDLRAPVRAMQGYAKAVLEDYGERLDAPGREYLDRIVRGSVRMDRLIQDILTYSRLSRREIRLQPVSLDKLVHEIVQQYPEMRSSHARITIHSPLPDVLAHEPSLSQVISNLLANSIKFVEPGITPEIDVRAEQIVNDVRFSVSDNGIGIKPEYQHRLFGMFERIHPEKNFEGTGIGLAIVRKAVERMDGKVGVESDGIHGSKFWIQLPAVKPE